MANATAEMMAGQGESKQREHYVTIHPRSDRAHLLRVIEALLFAASEPVTSEALAQSLPEGADVQGLLDELQRHYAGRGVNVVQVAGKWTIRTAGDLIFLLRREASEQKRLSRAALETLADHGVLRPTDVPNQGPGRPRAWWVAGELLDLLTR